MKNTKKQKEKEKRCAACVWRDRKTATPLCALPRCIYEERKPRRDKVKRYGEVQPGFVARCMDFAVDCKRQPAQLLHKPRMETPAAGSVKTSAPPLLGLRTQSAGGE